MTPTGSGILSLIQSASLISKAVLLILLGLSVFSWAVIIFKWKQFRSADRENRLFLGIFSMAEGPTVVQAAERHLHSPMAAMWLGVIARRATSSSGSPGRSAVPLETLLRRAGELEMSRHEEYLPFLATTGNVSPFIGLFGTVLGIITAFQAMSQMGSASISAVAPGIAEALVATAAGLFAAIPAVVAYNYFLNRLRLLSIQLDLFAAEAVERYAQVPGDAAAKG